MQATTKVPMDSELADLVREHLAKHTKSTRSCWQSPVGSGTTDSRVDALSGRRQSGQVQLRPHGQ
jgi:hypothetical protein